jgi:hypothetical protein
MDASVFEPPCSNHTGACCHKHSMHLQGLDRLGINSHRLYDRNVSSCAGQYDSKLGVEVEFYMPLLLWQSKPPPLWQQSTCYLANKQYSLHHTHVTLLPHNCGAHSSCCYQRHQKASLSTQNLVSGRAAASSAVQRCSTSRCQLHCAVAELSAPPCTTCTVYDDYMSCTWQCMPHNNSGRHCSQALLQARHARSYTQLHKSTSPAPRSSCCAPPLPAQHPL